MSSQHRTVTLPESLCHEMEERWIGKEFEDLESLLRFVIEELLRTESESLDREERETLEQRLRDLGYLR